MCLVLGHKLNLMAPKRFCTFVSGGSKPFLYGTGTSVEASVCIFVSRLENRIHG